MTLQDRFKSLLGVILHGVLLSLSLGLLSLGGFCAFTTVVSLGYNPSDGIFFISAVVAVIGLLAGGMLCKFSAPRFWKNLNQLFAADVPPAP